MNAALSMARSQPVLPAGELVLRPWREDDAPELVRAYGDPDIAYWHARALTHSEAVAWVRSRAERWQTELGADWAVTRADLLVGRAALRTIDLAEGWAEVAYWVLPEHRGRGVASSAVDALTDWAFDGLGLHRLELLHSTGNPASCRIASRAGFVAEGVKRSAALHADGWHDMHLHALLADDPR